MDRILISLLFLPAIVVHSFQLIKALGWIQYEDIQAQIEYEKWLKKDRIHKVILSSLVIIILLMLWIWVLVMF
ncbi:MAG: hypothetical protein HOP30_11755 [Cyclobacteriaceae bacterium]|nr:hypothetical protein [Cyclobacteriaceae bacterium]